MLAHGRWRYLPTRPSVYTTVREAVRQLRREQVHPLHKMRKLVLLGRQGRKQRIARIHGYFRLCSLKIKDLQKNVVVQIPPSPPFKPFSFNYL
jgi:hypothetical protein